jgi:FAD dependent oxidoreductase TIGR03364
VTYQLAIVGAGIVGLAHALAAVRLGLSVVVIERDARPVGASIRNFGFVTVTGQRRGETWRRAKRSAEIWMEAAPRAGIEVVHNGLLVLARRPEAAAVLEAFAATEMGEGCVLLRATEAQAKGGGLRPESLSAGLWSPLERRVESRLAIPSLVAWLGKQGVVFQFSTAVQGIGLPIVETSRGAVHAEAVVVCPGDDLSSLFPDAIAAQGVTRCILQMLRLAPPGFRLPGAVMSDLSLVRYRGYADLPESAPLLARLQTEQPQELANGIHLIAVQSADGSLVVGDSHHYAATPEPFASDEVDELILAETKAALGAAPPVRARWTGTYSSAAQDMFRAAPEPGVRVVMITSGTGASTAFAIAEETLHDLFGSTFERPLP